MKKAAKNYGTTIREAADLKSGKTRTNYTKVAKRDNPQITGINPDVTPSGTGCVECLKSGKGWWLHLRRCAECGHIGCCDNSPMKHATAHFHTAHHPITQSFEPGERWFFDYRAGQMIDPGIKLADPQSHPFDQPVPFYVGRQAKQ